MESVKIDYEFSEVDSKNLTNTLLDIAQSPYSNYTEFCAKVREIADMQGCVPSSFVDFCERKRRVSRFLDPYVMLKNCPVDQEIPFLDLESPVTDKRKRKKTYVAEAFLELYARLMRQEPIGYVNVNDGDIFQDIHPMKKLMNSQSQKAAGSIFFHKDLANHFVRPDWVNILGLRSSMENEIYTTFVSNKEILEYLDSETLEVLRCTEYHTPYDDLTVASGNKILPSAPNHQILGGAEDYDIRFFENRTVGITDRAKIAVEKLVDALHKLKKFVNVHKGDFIGSANNECIHSKEIMRVGDPDGVLNRWLIKTVNVKSLDQHKKHMVSGEIRIVNG
jgi:L-asparagine oxygenase